MKKKIFFIYGRLTSFFTKIAPLEFYMFNPESYREYTEVIEIGNPDTGVNLTEITDGLTSNINNNDQDIKIILVIHGDIIDGTYKLIMSKENGKAIELPIEKIIQHLSFSAEGRPIKIFATCCYGANIREYTNLLPTNSLIISLSDLDKLTSACDFYGKISLIMLKLAAEHGSIFKYLLPIYMFNQKIIQNTPIISLVTNNNEIKLISLSDYIDEFFQKNIKPNNKLFTDLLKKEILIEEILGNLINDLKDVKSVTEYKIPNLLNQAVEAFLEENEKDFLGNLMKKYYPTYPKYGTYSQELKLNFGNYEELLAENEFLKRNNLTQNIYNVIYIKLGMIKLGQIKLKILKNILDVVLLEGGIRVMS
ncbi:MAG: hypothetical protein RCO49_03460 [Rickettsia endosymbiont of Argas persicus]